jgi:uncharacterized RDD family membrane protein YckC
MSALGITILKNNAPWGPFNRTQIDDGMARGDFTIKYLAHAPGLKEWLPLGEVLDYVERNGLPGAPSLPPVPGPRDLPPLPEANTTPATSVAPAPEKIAARPPILPSSFSKVSGHSTSAAPVAEEKPAATPEVEFAPRPQVQWKKASFLRTIAFLIDCAILFVPVVVLFVLGTLCIEIPGAWQHIDHESRMQEWALLERNVRDLAFLVAIGFGWLYGAGLECSEAQATIGKRWAGIKVIDANGERLSFLRATARYAAKYLSALPFFLGFIMALFSSRGLALHDRLTDTRVVRNNP